MKQIIILLSLLLSLQFLSAQEQKLRVAVFDPTSSSVAIDGGTKEAVRELISSVFVNTGKYNMVERSMLQQVMKEQKMSNTDEFDDTQATTLGKLVSANKVILSVVSMVGGRNMLSIKVIDVETATIDQQKTRIVSTNDLLDAVEPLTAELLGEAVASSNNANNPGKKVEPKVTEPQPENTVVVAPPQQVPPSGGEGNISLYFAGYTTGKNPGAKIYVDGVFVGTGTLHQGFSVSFSESYAGNHTVRIEWESVISTKNYSVNTNFKKQFVFEYIRGGFGYEFRLKN